MNVQFASPSLSDVKVELANSNTAALRLKHCSTETGHTKRVFQEMNSVVWQAIDKQLQSLNSVVWQAIDKQLQSLPVFHDCYSLDQATFDAIETRLLTHFSVSVDRFGPGGSARERRAWASSIKLKYRNARRLISAQLMAQYIAQLEENTHAMRAKHYIFWMIVRSLT